MIMKRIFMPLYGVGLLAVCSCAEVGDAGRSYGSTADSVPDAVSTAREAAPRYARKIAPARSAGRNNFQVPAGHQMTFTARIRLSVSNVRDAIDQSRRLAMKLNGYVKRVDDNSTVLAIPVKNADGALAELSKLGVVSSLMIQGDDVTQQVTDLAIRLDNLEKSRKRLLALLEKAGKVDEMVKVENAINRVTTELERLQAQQKNLRSRIDYVTINVYFSAAAVQRVMEPTSPVSWVNSLGSDLLSFNQRLVNNDESLIIDLKLPQGFVKNGSAGAVSGDHCVIELAGYVNAVTATHWYGNDYADIGFYDPMIAKALGKRFDKPVTRTRCRIDGCDAVVYTVKPLIGGVSYTFRVAVAVVKSQVKIIKVRARTAVFEKAMPETAWKQMLESVDF